MKSIHKQIYNYTKSCDVCMVKHIWKKCKSYPYDQITDILFNENLYILVKFVENIK